MKYVGLYDNNKDIVTKEKLDAVESTIPTKTSQLDNDSGFITSAPVTSVNTKTGAVLLTASDVSAIPSTLTGTAGQVLTKTADGQEWADAASPKATKITLTVADWDSTDKYQLVEIYGFGITSDATKQEIRVMPVDATIDSAYISNGVQCIGQGNNLLRFGCNTIPTEAIEVYVVIQNINYSV